MRTSFQKFIIFTLKPSNSETFTNFNGLVFNPCTLKKGGTKFSTSERFPYRKGAWYPKAKIIDPDLEYGRTYSIPIMGAKKPTRDTFRLGRETCKFNGNFL